MGERDQPCTWCKGSGNLRGQGGCGLCGDTGWIGYSVGDEPYRRPRREKTKRATPTEAMALAVEAISRGSKK